MKINFILFLLLATITLINSSTIENRAGAGTVYPTFKVKSCPMSIVGVATLTGSTTPKVGIYTGSNCVESLTDTSITVTTSCISTTDADFGAPVYLLTINTIRDGGNNLYKGAFYIKDYNYGSIQVALDRDVGYTYIYKNTYQCITDFCGTGTFFEGCKTSLVTEDLSGSGSSPIIATTKSDGTAEFASVPFNVDLCNSAGSSCCALPNTCSSTYTIAYPPTDTADGSGIDKPGNTGGAAQAVAQPFVPPTGSTTVTSFGFVISSDKQQVSFSAYIYEWDTVNLKVVGSPLFSKTNIGANKQAYSLETVIVPANTFTFSSGKVYAAILSARDNSVSQLINTRVSSVTALSAYYTFTNDWTQSWTGWPNSLTLSFSATFV